MRVRLIREYVLYASTSYTVENTVVGWSIWRCLNSRKPFKRLWTAFAAVVRLVIFHNEEVYVCLHQTTSLQYFLLLFWCKIITKLNDETDRIGSAIEVSKFLIYAMKKDFKSWIDIAAKEKGKRRERGIQIETCIIIMTGRVDVHTALLSLWFLDAPRLAKIICKFCTAFWGVPRYRREYLKFVFFRGGVVDIVNFF